MKNCSQVEISISVDVAFNDYVNMLRALGIGILRYGQLDTGEQWSNWLYILIEQTFQMVSIWLYWNPLYIAYYRNVEIWQCNWFH
jgi:hypothetical protein